MLSRTMGLGLAVTAASLPTGLLGWLAVGLGVLAELYGAQADCAKPYKEMTESAKNTSLSLAAQFENEFWDWVKANGGMAPPR